MLAKQIVCALPLAIAWGCSDAPPAQDRGVGDQRANHDGRGPDPDAGHPGSDARRGERDGSPAPKFYAGVNLAGAEFGQGKYPGVYAKDYIYPTHQEVDYFFGKGLKLFRLPFAWERLQRQLKTPLDASELAHLDDFVQYATGKGAHVILDPHNYARYSGQVIGGVVEAAALADLWTRLAQRYNSNARVIYGLMNEPHDMPTETWRDSAQAAVQAIRSTGSTNLILVPGNAWSGAFNWTATYYGTPNSVAMLKLADPGGNFAFEVHQYLDGDSSGTSESCVGASIGSSRLAAFTQWARQQGKKALLAEFAGGRNATCYAALEDMLAYIDANRDVWIGWAWWAAGPWWGNYFFTLEPSGGQDQPQLAILLKHL
jgi:endoglucanase